MKITVFTPTFNRAYIIERLYNSLCHQSFKGFEWIIVDDGSTDNTEETIGQWLVEDKISIKYYKQQNKGKHFAINKGVNKSSGELFFIVDSDDYLPNDSLEKINFYFEKHKSEPNFGGISGKRANFDGTIIGFPKQFEPVFCNALDIRFKYKITGDFGEVFLTSVLKEFPFPEIENEKFCPEALLWNRIAQKYKLIYLCEKTYFCEYIPDGLTAKIVKIRMTSPIASMICYGELNSYEIPIKEKIKASINFWRFSFNSNLSFYKKLKLINHYPTIIGLPVGFAMFILDKIKQR
jgi:glycosyltransferase involved in cell wall biosynthesis